MDWKSLIAELQAFGLSQGVIAERCRCGQSTISELSKGVTKDPRHSIGEALRRLVEEKRAEKQAAPADGAPIYTQSDNPGRRATDRQLAGEDRALASDANQSSEKDV